MGWKALKEKYGIDHAVQVAGDLVCIGSAYVHDLVKIDTKTGAIRENGVFSNFVREKYPALAASSAQDILAVIEAADQFTASIPVYTYDGAEIIEKLCEEPGWPNVTHDGCMMYENTFSTDKAEVVGWAKRNATSLFEWQERTITETVKKLAEERNRLEMYRANRLSIDTEFPDIEPAK